jgi:hypothetical protein
MSTLGVKRTSPFAGIRFRGRYWGQSGDALLDCICPLMSQSGHAQRCLICRNQVLPTRCPAFAFAGEHRQENDRNSQCE